MAQTPSTMLELGTAAPDFSLGNVVDGRKVSLSDFKNHPALWVMFICNHCPFVVHIRQELVKLANEAVDRGVGVVAINSNSIRTHPQDGPENMRKLAAEEKWKFPFLFDESQEVAKAYRAACTPDLYLFDAQKRLFYRGQFDDSRPSNGKPVTGADFKHALDGVLASKEAPGNQRPSIGCNIKWSPGNEPPYYGAR
jgi:peroxiredoxin